MKIAQLLHNPNAGNGEHKAEELIRLIGSAGFICRYASVKKKNWNIDPEADLLVIAGGDGTVRKVLSVLVNRRMLDKRYPIGILPLGTANNIGKAFRLDGDLASVVTSWKDPQLRPVDIGRISGLKSQEFFIEGLGFGVFPGLMLDMKKAGEGTAEEQLQRALRRMLRIAERYRARYCRLEIDGADHSGRFLLAEIMNIPSIGPNLYFNPAGDPGDGAFEIVLVPEEEREQLIAYLEARIGGNEEPFGFHRFTGSDIRISWDSRYVHIDDVLLKRSRPVDVRVALQPALFGFLAGPTR